jgi:hypothetical protein
VGVLEVRVLGASFKVPLPQGEGFRVRGGY